MNTKTVEERITRAGWTSGTSNTAESLAASRAVLMLIKKRFPDCKITHNVGHFYCSGFVRRGDRVVYYNVGDYRSGFAPYVRTAKDERDYTGGVNNHCTIHGLTERIDWLLGYGADREAAIDKASAERMAV